MICPFIVTALLPLQRYHDLPSVTVTIWRNSALRYRKLVFFLANTNLLTTIVTQVTVTLGNIR